MLSLILLAAMASPGDLVENDFKLVGTKEVAKVVAPTPRPKVVVPAPRAIVPQQRYYIPQRQYYQAAPYCPPGGST